MAYTPIGWQTGDTITAEKMNKMDNGWSVDSSQLFSESVTTAVDPEYPDDPPYAQLEYSTEITADTIVVTFDGIDYTCDKQGALYGGVGYPFRLMSIPGFGNTLETDVAGTYEISVGTSSVETSASFQTAVNSFVDTSTMPMLCVSGVTTYADMESALNNGRILYFRPYQQALSMCFITSLDSSFVNFIPENSQIAVGFVDGIFSVSYT